jgi:hypothetical protein
MRDNQIEDRLRTELRREGESLPLTITPDELDRRLSLRRRERKGRRAGLIAASLAVVAIGSLVVAGGGWFAPATVGTTPVPIASSEPSLAPTSGPTEAGLPCTTIKPNAADQPPTMIIGAVPGDSIAFGGALGAYRLGDRADGVEGDWTSIDPRALDRVPAGPPTERLQVLASNPDACLTGLVAEAIPFGQIGPAATTFADVTRDPTRVIEFAIPSAGEWLVRARVAFATASGVDAWSETFFRVDARNPAASLGTVLGNLPLLDAPPATIFVDRHSDALEPADATGLTEETVVGQVESRSMYIVDIVCLGPGPMRWSIGHEGQFGFLAAGDQSCDGTPSERSVELGIPSGDLDVVMQGNPAAAWRIRVATIAGAPAFVPPPLRLWVTTDADGTAGAAEAYGRCVSTDQASDQCAGEWFVLDGARSILAALGSSLTFALQDGWEITQARVTAAVTDQVRAKPFVPEYSVGFVDSGGAQVTVPVQLGRGSWIIRVTLNATRGGVGFGAYYDLPLIVGE